MGLSSVQEHNQQVVERFGFETEIPSHDLLQMSFVFSRWESDEGDKKAEEVVDYAPIHYPNIADEFFHIVEELTNNDSKQPGKDFHQLLCRKFIEHKECNGLTISNSPSKIVALPISSEEQERIVGRYRYRYDTDMLLTISAENNRVFMQYLDDKKMEVSDSLKMKYYLLNT